MSRICQLTGKKVMVGNNVSHSNRRTKRRFYPNLFKKRFFIPEEDRWVTLRVSASGIRNIKPPRRPWCHQQGEGKGHLDGSVTPPNAHEKAPPLSGAFSYPDLGGSPDRISCCRG